MSPSRDTPSPRVLVADPDEASARELLEVLDAAGYAAERCARPDRLARKLAAAEWDAVVAARELDVTEDLLARAAEDGPAVILLDAFGSVHDAVEAIRAGAADYLAKPVDPDQVALALSRAIDERRLREENRRLREEVGERWQLGRFVSRDPRMARVLDVVRSVADTRATLLITGESGTGKTLLARGVHRLSTRRDGPFVAVHCGALPANLLESELFGHVRGAFTGAVKDRAGRFEEADGGTIFLDEIGTAPLDLQIKLLRVLQDREFERIGDSRTRKVDVRVIAATNSDLAAEVAAGRFREDLLYRLAVVTLELPPLRERPADVRLLAERFVERFTEEYGRPGLALADETVTALLAHSWPGNVRELENVIERAVLLARGDRILPEHLPAELAAAAPSPAAPPRTLKEALAEPERRLIVEALERAGGCRKRAAEALGINRSTLFNKMRKYGLLEGRRGES